MAHRTTVFSSTESKEKTRPLKAVIVAAGLSSRLYPITLKKPKGLLEVGDCALLERSVKILKKHNIHNIAIVVGFEKEQVVSMFGKSVTYLQNPFYKFCNNMGSLWFAKKFVGNSPFVYMHGDIIYTEKLFCDAKKHFFENNNDIELVTDYFYSDKESMKVRCTKDKFLIESNKQIPLDKSDGEWIGMSFIRKPRPLFKKIEQIVFEDTNLYDTYAFTEMAQEGHKIFCSSTNNEKWLEIDFDKDFYKAKKLFS